MGVVGSPMLSEALQRPKRKGVSMLASGIAELQRPGSIHICYGQEDGQLRQVDGLLSRAEISRGEQLIHRSDRFGYLTLHAAMRLRTAEYLGVPPSSVQIGKLPCPCCGDIRHGPPAILSPRTDLRITATRSSGSWAFAVAIGFPIGLDMERFSEDLNTDRVASAAMSEEELQFFHSSRASQRTALFYRCWTRKEAILKAIGIGLAIPLPEITVASTSESGAVMTVDLGDAPTSWAVEDFTPFPLSYMALASPAAISTSVSFVALNPDLSVGGG